MLFYRPLERGHGIRLISSEGSAGSRPDWAAARRGRGQLREDHHHEVREEAAQSTRDPIAAPSPRRRGGADAPTVRRRRRKQAASRSGGNASGSTMKGRVEVSREVVRARAERAHIPKDPLHAPGSEASMAIAPAGLALLAQASIPRGRGVLRRPPRRDFVDEPYITGALAPERSRPRCPGCLDRRVDDVDWPSSAPPAATWGRRMRTRWAQPCSALP